ncbi:metal-sulfur cluster assembly factor [Methanothermococcus sp. SCGC AD-155-E23]|nr:metal-sulfur cluster assembly factor [Methanothermococcus sp. SCGC AD-155-E23]
MVSKEDVIKALKNVKDPHMGISIVDMGLVKNVEIDEENNVSFELIPTNPACMSVMGMALGAKEEVKKIEGVKDVKVIVKGHIMEEDINKIVNNSE